MDEVIITVELAGHLPQSPEVQEVGEGGVERGERRSSHPGHAAEVRPEAGQLDRLRALEVGPLNVERVDTVEEGGGCKVARAEIEDAVTGAAGCMASLDGDSVAWSGQGS